MVKGTKEYEFGWDKETMNRIANFDAGKKMKPFTFTALVTSME